MKQLFSFLLIPHKACCHGGACRVFNEVLIPIDGGTEKVKLIAFNCDKPEEISPIVQGFVNKYRKEHADSFTIETEAWSKFCLNQILKKQNGEKISSEVITRLSQEFDIEINPEKLIYFPSVENRWKLFKESISRRLSTQH